MEKELKQESLLDKWKNREQKTTSIKPIEKAPPGVKIPLSYGQKRLFFLQQLYPDNPFYNYSETYTFIGELVKEHLIESLKKVYNDHDILRTTYHADGDTVFQEVDASAKMEISTHDLSKLNELDAEIECHKIMLADATKYFELDKGPLVRASLIKINDLKHILQITLHHIVTDKWSMQIFRAHVAHYYRQFNKDIRLSELKNQLQYTDYAYWLENQEINNDHLNYWKNKLSGEIPNLNLPTDYSRPKHPSFKGAASYTQVFNKDLSGKLLKLSKKLETTPFNLMLSVYYIMLYKYSGQTDILIGTPVTNRNQKALEDLIGFFNDTIVLRTNLSPSMTFMDFVGNVRTNTLEAFSNKDVPFDILVRELKTNRNLSINPFFQVMFLYHSVPENPFFDDNLSLTHTWFDSKVAKFDLTIYISEEHGLFSSTFEYASDLFEEETINRFQDYFKLLLEGIVSNPNIVIADIPIINEKEKTFLCNQKNEFSNHLLEEQAIHKIIEQIASKYPENKAVTFGNVSMTYKELDHKASLVAQSLLKNITTRNEVIGLCLDRSINMIVGMLGILKAGCAYLPIDADYPKERVNFMLKDSNVKILLTQKNITIHDTGLDISTLFIENLTDTINELNTLDYPQTSEDDLAYIIYTSGSTGQPKGVPITHKSIINSTTGRIYFYNHNPSAFLLLSSISFDSSKAGIFWTLCTGGNLVISEKRLEQDIDKIGNILKDHSISHTLMLPSLYKTILEYTSPDSFGTLKTVIVAGEACTESLCDYHFNKLPKVKLYNEYGPTEATVWCIAYEITKATIKSSIPIGRPVAGANIYLLDEKLNLVPKGAIGEIYIGGTGLSKGYLNRPELTRQVFITNPFNTEEKLYKTGDLGKFRNDGNIVFLGRKDQQVKIRGFRVELEEIEQTLMDSIMFHGVVLNLENNHLDNESESSSEKPKQLVAYVIAKTHYNKAALKSYLKKRIPNYMIPAKIIELEAFPKLPNGKIDKKALSILKYAHSSANQKDSNVELPKNETEQVMLQIWQDVLNIDAISTNDNFFEIGGDSILSIQIIAKARKMGMMISPNQLFEFQNIKDLSEYIDVNKNTNESWDYVAPLRKEGYKKPLFCIHAGGGHVFFYNLLTEYIDPERPIYAIQPSGLYGSEAMHKNVQEMTDDYIESITKIQPDGPYNVVVYCLSVAIGHEMAIQMKKRGMDLNLIVMDTMANPWKLNTKERKLIRAKNFYKRFKKKPFQTIKLIIVDRIPSLSLKIKKLLSINKKDHFQKVKDNLVNICVDYIWKPYPVKISLILTEKHEESLNEETIKSWKNLASDGVEILFTKGNHRTLFEKPDIAFVAKTIEKCLK
ncbi:non-ribosomal peptide synthetase [Confluentibacter flavum]|uniref:Carrier domain-containing protein n=1 Tax=Confluentibacter flavum TaxID=1909700 RepID=A0A2N3HGQ4_9FLAO|nr:non-ribosomal peptide synthetase [Confluentibacter flavum]PKQ44146.1 hypothetical protein CSW08_15255 [Confluentibacter flavum]